MTDQTSELVRVYLDVDGVLNAVVSEEHLPNAGWNDYERVTVSGWPITFAPELIETLNAIASTPGVSVHWLTTWCHDAPKLLAPAIGLDGTQWPVVGYENWKASRGMSWWKHLAAVEHLADYDGAVVWIDDDHGVDPGCRAWLAGQPQVVAIAPDPRLGVTRDEATLLTDFIRRATEETADA